MKQIVGVFLVIVFCCNYNYVNAENIVSEPIKIKWGNIQSDVSSFNNEVKYLSFENANIDLPNPVPYYSYKIKLGSINDIVTNISLQNEQVENVNAEEQKIVEKVSLKSKFSIEYSIESERKTNYLIAKIIPIRKSGIQFEKLNSFNLNITISKKGMSKISSKSYVSNSVLANGSWFKVGVVKDGIYKIDYNFLKKIGVDVNTVNPQNIRVYGNGGKQLSYLNSTQRIDDLIENPIMVVGEADGRLDSLDYFWFYGHGPHYWEKTNTCPGYRHQLHGFSDTTYYFINYDLGSGLRFSTVPQSSSTLTNNITSYDDLQFIETESINMRNSGREFYGEKFDNILSNTFNFNAPNISFNDSSTVNTNVLGVSLPSATFNVGCSGVTKSVSPKVAQALGPGANDYQRDIGSEDSVCFKFIPSSNNVTVQVDFVKNPLFSAGFGYLNYIEVVLRRNLKLFSNQVLFRDSKSVGTGNIGKYIIENAEPSTIVLNVTNPTQAFIQASNYSGNSIDFLADCGIINEYIAFTPATNAMVEPMFYGMVQNQNLHSTTKRDMIIISHSLFLEEANRLKKMHEEKDNLSVEVVTPQQIYNEFSGGLQDIAGLRMFCKMLYDKAPNTNDIPKYLLLFGDASFNNRVRSPNGNTNFVPVYESSASLDLIYSYCTDDFFGMLDDNESDSPNSLLDIAIGRLPAKTAAEAKTMVDKIIDYKTKKPLSNNSTFCPTCDNTNTNTSNSAIFNGDWRNVLTLIADDEDSNAHLGDAESNAQIIKQKEKDINVEKIYLDAYKQITDAGGQRYPEVNKAINERINKGALIINYSGHGGEIGWANERILGVEDIKSWKNNGRYPFFITATCEFTRYDDPSRTSAGELTLLQPEGGGIGLATTTRLVIQSYNRILNNTFYQILFDKDSISNAYRSLGEILRLVKNTSIVVSSGINSRKFSLMGDPALKLDLPEYVVSTTKVEVLKDVFMLDTLKALSKVRVTGFVGDKNNVKLTNFTGLIYPTVFDKESTASTLKNDNGSPKTNFKIRKSVVYKGKVSVTKGDFVFEFIVPKDIAYQYGTGRISYFAETDASEAKGNFENFIIGGVNENAPTDNTGPTVKMFMNDDKFINGSITNENPTLIAYIEDENGINTVGTGLGHDISVVLDNKTDKSIVLNDYYQAELNSYQKGNLLYGFNSLEEGSHNLRLKIWDVYNNSTDANIDFIVAKNANIALKHVLNYPNPFTTNTTFFFEHNKPCQSIDVQIQIFSVSGKLVKTINENITTTGFRSQDINWNGLDDYGDKIGKGVYIYQIKVTAQDGTVAEQLEKLVLLN